MSQSVNVDAIERFSLKLFTADGPTVRSDDVIPLFHRWIRDHAVPGLLIDVADYGHLPDSPNVLLVAHEANYVFDCDTRAGLTYVVKRKTPGSLADRIVDAARILFAAALRMGHDTAADTGAAVAFRTDRIELVINDRLHAPKTPDVESALQGTVGEAARSIFGATRVESVPLADAGRTGVTLRISDAPPLDRLG